MFTRIAHLTALIAFSLGFLCAGAPKYDGELSKSDTEIDIDSLDAKIGQMILVGFKGMTVTESDPIYWDLRDRKLGGVILFDYDVPTQTRNRNIRSPKQLKALTEQLRGYSETPLFISIDQEGGLVNRLKPRYGFPGSLSAQELGEINDTTNTRKAAQRIGSTLRNHGINLNFAPVVDVNTNTSNPIIGTKKRSFSSDPQAVSDHAEAFINGQLKENVISVLKHFPGHGSSTGDTHQGLTDVTDSWDSLELTPYRNLIERNNVQMIMTAHIVNKKLDPSGKPATLSKLVMTDILRDSLNFEGVIVSDDMQMGAIREYYGFKEAIQLALEAGVDILVFGNNSQFDEDVALKALSVIRRMVLEGDIPESKIEDSYRRIMKLKKEVLSS